MSGIVWFQRTHHTRPLERFLIKASSFERINDKVPEATDIVENTADFSPPAGLQAAVDTLENALGDAVRRRIETIPPAKYVCDGEFENSFHCCQPFGSYLVDLGRMLDWPFCFPVGLIASVLPRSQTDFCRLGSLATY